MKFANTVFVWEVRGEVLVIKLLPPFPEPICHDLVVVFDGGRFLLIKNGVVKKSLHSNKLKVSFKDNNDFSVPIEQVDYVLDQSGQPIFEQRKTKISARPD